MVYGTARSVAWKYLFPGIAGMLLFVAFPRVYTVQIGFTNYSASNLLAQDRARAYLLDQTVADEAQARPFTLHAEGSGWRLKLAPADGGAGKALVSPPFALRADAPPTAVPMQPLGTTTLADPLLAKLMILIVNTWLGYPYTMILCTGLIKAIPADLYEASAIAGAGPLSNFFTITVPLIAQPLTPLLISAFAFNFDNFVLISLLTDGRPDYLNTKLPAGTTDILVSYTKRIAFTDSGQNFGLAAVISTLLFMMVAILALLQLKITQPAEANR